MKTPATWKHLKRHPLSAEYEDLVGEPWDNLIADLQENGFDETRPITLDHENKVVDGWQRLRGCIACDIMPTCVKLPEGTDLEAYVRRHNDNRRHESETQRSRRIEARRVRVAEAIAAGESKRSIAEKEGVSRPTIDSDVKAIEESGGNPLPPDGKVTGKDGKQQSATKPKPVPPPPANDEPPKPKAGKSTVNDKKLIEAYGVLVRQVDAVMSRGRRHTSCQYILGQFLNEFQQWKKENA